MTTPSFLSKINKHSEIFYSKQKEKNLSMCVVCESESILVLAAGF